MKTQTEKRKYCVIRPDLMAKRLKIPYDGGYIQGYCEMEYTWKGDDFFIWINGGFKKAESLDFDFCEEKENPKTKVRFLIVSQEPEFANREVFAYFPQLNYSKPLYGNRMKTCYAHLGQHSPCSVEYAKECIEATPEQYEELETEIRGIYGEIQVLNKAKSGKAKRMVKA